MLTLTSPVEIWAHRVPAGAKLAALAVFTMAVFAAPSPQVMALAGATVAGLVASGGFGFARSSLALLRPLVPFVAVVVIWHLVTQDIAGGLTVLLRMVTAVTAANFVTMTTRLSDMLAVIERLLSPLSVLGLRPRPLALALALVIRFVPVMLLRFDNLSAAFRARSPRRAGWRVLMPATLAALDDADHVAEALRARGGAG